MNKKVGRLHKIEKFYSLLANLKMIKRLGKKIRKCISFLFCLEEIALILKLLVKAVHIYIYNEVTILFLSIDQVPWINKRRDHEYCSILNSIKIYTSLAYRKQKDSGVKKKGGGKRLVVEEIDSTQDGTPLTNGHNKPSEQTKKTSGNRLVIEEVDSTSEPVQKVSTDSVKPVEEPSKDTKIKEVPKVTEAKEEQQPVEELKANKTESGTTKIVPDDKSANCSSEGTVRITFQLNLGLTYFYTLFSSCARLEKQDFFLEKES